jgi:hypothetical protein
VWSGDGWKRTQRQLGAGFLALAYAAEVGLNANIPVAFYTVVGGLLGLDIILEGIDRLKGRDRE